ncbi:MAG TPA: FecR domain-containing protein, partial [Gemmatimonadaceae bacterium]|nr:FecR domain-containing protein [Gemmatimonadaceae bacterium]
AMSARMDERPHGQTTRRSSGDGHMLRLRSATFAQRSRYFGSRAAAIILAVALGAFAARQAGWRRSSAPRPVVHAAVMREVTTKRGQQANVYLSDGTLVVLGVGSTLRFPTAFDSSRDVELTGEAYFEVAHDTTRSFFVHTKYGTARDLGTKFGVRAYRDISAATVTVTEGSVLLMPNNLDDKRNLVLGARDVARVSADGRLSVLRNVRTDQNLAWVTGRLVFDRMPVGEAIAQINRWYDANVQLGDSTLAGFTLTASLSNEPFGRAIKIIAGALDARIERRHSTYTLFASRSRS